MKFGAIIIGDEILAGKRKAGHLAKTIETLGARGLQLAWSYYLGDDPELIAATFTRTFASGDAVFSFGGIGATPDDHTRAAAARAGGVPLKLHADAEAEIRARFVNDPKGVTPQRLAMGEFPEGSEIIPNPYNRIRSEERRVGKECRSRWSPYHSKKKKKKDRSCKRTAME